MENMTMDTQQIAGKLYEEFNKHNIPGILDLLNDDVVWSSFSVDWALAVGFFKGHDGVQDFFGKLVGPQGQQTDVMFEPMHFFVSEQSVHVIGVEKGYFTEYVKKGKLANKPFFNNFDHTIWFDAKGKIKRFRANYNMAQTAPTFWPLQPGVPGFI
jgi:ketosteroid isomerase-like protein